MHFYGVHDTILLQVSDILTPPGHKKKKELVPQTAVLQSSNSKKCQQTQRYINLVLNRCDSKCIVIETAARFRGASIAKSLQANSLYFLIHHLQKPHLTNCSV